MRSKLEPLARLFPMGWPWSNEVMGAACAAALSALTAFALFVYRFGNAVDDLYTYDPVSWERELIPGAMVPFSFSPLPLWLWRCCPSPTFSFTGREPAATT